MNSLNIAKSVFFVRSAEVVPCPCCGEALEVIGSRKRICKQSGCDDIWLNIRRMRCVSKSCGKIHHELPDILVPYKRYATEHIEQVISTSTPIDVAVDEATLYRWRCWFRSWRAYAIGCLESIRIRFSLGHPVQVLSGPAQSALQSIGHYVGEAPGWLSQVVRSIANAHLWLHTRSAFLSAEP
jgi:hypothetical protein